jgi:F420-0:gamma-glutamyl ligase-like protein
MKILRGDLKNLTDVLIALNYTVSYTGGGHIKITDPDGSRCVFTGSTPSAPTAYRNLQAQLKREFGVDFKALLADSKKVKQILKAARK